MRTGDERTPQGLFHVCPHATPEEGRPVQAEADGWCDCHGWACVGGLIPFDQDAAVKRMYAYARACDYIPSMGELLRAAIGEGDR